MYTSFVKVNGTTTGYHGGNGNKKIGNFDSLGLCWPRHAY